MKTRSKNPANGFTLIELLVAMAITTIIISILVSVTALSLDAWNRSRSEVRAARQGKAMIDSMARDFESLVIRKGNNFEWLLAKSKNSSDSDFPKVNNDNNKASPNVIDLIFFSAATDRYEGNIGTATDLGGDVSTVGYQLAYKDPITASTTDDNLKTFVMYRKLVDPKETFEKNLGQATLAGKLDFLTSGVSAVSAKENFICENVYQFTITFHTRVSKTTVTGTAPNTTSTTTITPVAIPIGQTTTASASTKEFRITGAGIQTDFIPTVKDSNNVAITNAELKSAQLSAVEISLTVLSDFGLKQLQKRTLTDAEKTELIAKNSYQYSKLVQVPGS